MAIPLDKILLNQGVHRAMALHLLEKHQLTLVQSAKIANLSAEAFIELLAEAGITAVD